MSAEGQLLTPGYLRRQEVIALINTLHQFSKSIEFASSARAMELENKVSTATNAAAFVTGIGALVAVGGHWILRKKYQHKQS